MYVCMYVYVHIYMYMYICTYVYIHIDIIYVYIYNIMDSVCARYMTLPQALYPLPPEWTLQVPYNNVSSIQSWVGVSFGLIRRYDMAAIDPPGCPKKGPNKASPRVILAALCWVGGV